MNNRNLRFEGYIKHIDLDNHWAKKAPAHWTCVRLRYVAKIHGGNGFPIDDQGSAFGNIPFYKVSDIGGQGYYVNESKNMITRTLLKAKGWNVVPKGSLIAAKIGEALKKNHRKIAEIDCVIDNNCIALEPVGVEERHFFYLHKSIDFEWFINPGAVPSISIRKYRDLTVFLPSLKEQRCIASFLDKKSHQIDQAIVIKQRQITLLKERKQILIQNAVTRGLDPFSPMRDSGVEWIGKIPEHWEISRSKLVFVQRRELARKNDIQLSATQSYGVIPQDEYEEKIGRRVVKIQFNLEKRKHVELNDFVISMRSFQGGLERAWASGCIRSSYVVLRPKIEVDPGYYGLLFKSRRYIEALQTTANFIRDGQDLNFENFSEVDLPIPPINEQRAIFQHVDAELAKSDHAADILERQISKLREYKATLINSAVTGKIKVPGVVEPEPEDSEVT